MRLLATARQDGVWRHLHHLSRHSRCLTSRPPVTRSSYVKRRRGVSHRFATVLHRSPRNADTQWVLVVTKQSRNRVYSDLAASGQNKTNEVTFASPFLPLNFPFSSFSAFLSLFFPLFSFFLVVGCSIQLGSPWALEVFESWGSKQWPGPWRARGAQAYNGNLGAESQAGSRGRAPGGGQGAKPF